MRLIEVFCIGTLMVLLAPYADADADEFFPDGQVRVHGFICQTQTQVEEVLRGWVGPPTNPSPVVAAVNAAHGGDEVCEMGSWIASYQVLAATTAVPSGVWHHLKLRVEARIFLGSAAVYASATYEAYTPVPQEQLYLLERTPRHKI